MLRRLTPEGPVSTIIQMNRLEVWLGAARARLIRYARQSAIPFYAPQSGLSFNVVYRLLSVEPNG